MVGLKRIVNLLSEYPDLMLHGYTDSDIIKPNIFLSKLCGREEGISKKSTVCYKFVYVRNCFWVIG